VLTEVVAEEVDDVVGPKAVTTQGVSRCATALCEEART
jgi:hypothetical protein